MNRTTPPASHHFEAASRPHTPLPHQVRWALILLWLCLTLSVAQYLVAVPGAVHGLPVDQVARSAAILGLAVPAALLAFDAFLNIAIAGRKNWARIAKLLLVLASVFIQFVVLPASTTVELYSGVLVYLLSFAALYLLFLTPGRLWFQQPS